MVNIKDIAKQAGMSPSTVSRVVNGKKSVNPETRAQILKLIKKNGYVPNQSARNMVLRRSFTVGIVIPDAFNMFQRQLFSIIERHLQSFGYHTMFFFVKSDNASEEDCLNRLKSEKLDGVIMLHEMKNHAFYEYLLRAKLPAITATFYSAGIPAIHVDEEQASLDAVNHLLFLGHRKIKMISGDSFTFGRQRAEGFLKAMAAAGLPRNERALVFVPRYSAEFGMYGMRELLLRDMDFTAVFAATDELALGALRVLNDEGLRVPDDISLIGFDDIEIADYLTPRLTTVRQPLAEMGEQTALSLHRQISEKTGSAGNLILPHRLIIRQSTAKIK
jgi:LacI family transcriptional regulator